MRRAKPFHRSGNRVPWRRLRQSRLAWNVARLNMSHGDHAEHQARYDTIREQSAKLGKDVATSPTCRAPRFASSVSNGKEYLESGADLPTITSEDAGRYRRNLWHHLARPAIVKPGDKLLPDDGKIRLEAIEVTPTRVRTPRGRRWSYLQQQGHQPAWRSSLLPALTEKDANDLRFAPKMVQTLLRLLRSYRCRR